MIAHEDPVKKLVVIVCKGVLVEYASEGKTFGGSQGQMFDATELIIDKYSP